MSAIYLFNKPYQVMSQFSPSGDKQTLSDYIDIPDIYPAGRLDFDSEGLLLLTDDGKLQARIADPKHKLPKFYWVQVEGKVDSRAIKALETGVTLNDGPTKKAQVQQISSPQLWQRSPPIRQRKDDETSWLEIVITEGRNRQVRRMTAHVGFPTLRLVRHRIGPWELAQLAPGELRRELVHLPQPGQKRNRKIHSRSRQTRKNR
ncbi:MAG: pseudouridine synthase [Oleiphilus sp.]|nr:MAG: pseudouridine synthase [Oleiphilus sp.]